jgi:hypothetical protein
LYLRTQLAHHSKQCVFFVNNKLSVIGTATRQRAEWSGFRIMVRKILFLFFKRFELPHPAFHSVDTGFVSSGKVFGHSVNHSPLSSTEHKNEWSCNSTLPTRSNDVGREYFIFLSYFSRVYFSRTKQKTTLMWTE